ncbi:hypothetical protein ElyMa_006059900 [Elysia marginata]|uniref:Reverse transcriptase domain-containing protein n=1 Tax=Elysia marginata TaxID=1093978 RepID=A0AAV4GMK7_9GAST|nr:hypothetical protein ElyMa_006059900 [Elysia marginata]
MIFSIRQLQEKCRGQRRSLYLAFIDLTKTFGLVSWTGLFTLLPRIGCLPKLLKMIMSFLGDTVGTIQYDDSLSDPFPIKSGVKQRCVTLTAPTLFGIFSPCATPSTSQKMAFSFTPEAVANYSTYPVSEQRQRCIKCSSKRYRCLLQTMLPSLPTPRRPFNDSSHEIESSLTISLKKTYIIGQHVGTTPTITTDEQILEVVDKSAYLGSTISNNLSLDVELNVRKGKASTTMARLSKRVWDDTMLTLNTKMRMYQACIVSTLLYGSESWTLYSHQEQRLNALHMLSLRPLQSITWQNRVTNTGVLAQPGMSSPFAILSQKRLRWLRHMCRMEDRRIPKDFRYCKLASASRPTGRPTLRFKDVCKRDLKTCGI